MFSSADTNQAIGFPRFVMTDSSFRLPDNPRGIWMIWKMQLHL